MTRHLVIMAKLPRCGLVKTRLGRDIGMVGAVWWYRHQLRRLQRRLGSDRRWKTVLSVSPDTAARRSACWSEGLTLWPQGGGSLGARLERVFRTASMGPMLVIGADIPDVAPHHVERGFRTLARHDAILGPSEDGGYWAIGLRRSRTIPKGLFAGVRWSTPNAFEDTRSALTMRLACKNIGLIDSLYDVDTAADLQRHSEEKAKRATVAGMPRRQGD